MKNLGVSGPLSTPGLAWVDGPNVLSHGVQSDGPSKGSERPFEEGRRERRPN